MDKLGTKLCDEHYLLFLNKIGEVEEFSVGNQFGSKCEICDRLWTHWLCGLYKTDDLSFEYTPYVYKSIEEYRKNFENYINTYIDKNKTL